MFEGEAAGEMLGVLLVADFFHFFVSAIKDDFLGTSAQAALAKEWAQGSAGPFDIADGTAESRAGSIATAFEGGVNGFGATFFEVFQGEGLGSLDESSDLEFPGGSVYFWAPVVADLIKVGGGRYPTAQFLPIQHLAYGLDIQKWDNCFGCPGLKSKSLKWSAGKGISGKSDGASQSVTAGQDGLWHGLRLPGIQS